MTPRIHRNIPLVQEHSSTIYEPYNPSDEAEICLSCPLKTCKPNDCNRYRQEKKKLISKIKKRD